MSWTEIPGGMLTTLPPAAVLTTDGTLYAFVVGQDQAVYVNKKTGGAWATSWTKIPGGQTKCGPAAAVNSLGTPSVIITGLDGKFYQTYLNDDGTWNAWESPDGGTGSSPASVARRRRHPPDVLRVRRQQQAHLHRHHHLRGRPLTG
ncbi:hypothetical protein [Actinocorallia herbida]|uniref:hypothetical protein n=1 Tax=Actinocorallia herbida TaxID=58109 RepID=UPI000F4BF15F|nr:hypothetical protein [Actinocorallia herbida]